MSSGTNLADTATTFAAELLATVRGVVPGVQDDAIGVDIATQGQDSKGPQRLIIKNPEPILLRINGHDALHLLIDLRCEWDHKGAYLAVRTSKIHVLPVGYSEPLFRYEFVHSLTAAPTAHLHLHAHRDELVYTMVRGTRGKPKVRMSAVDGTSGRAVPRLSDLHFPLGGPRYRPCVEDVLQLLVNEFDIETVQGYQEAIDAGRQAWRRRQLGAAVRDIPEEAARVLKELGYTVQPPESGPPEDKIDRLTQY